MKRGFLFLMKFIVFVCISAAIFAVSAYVGYLYITPSSYVNLNCIHAVKLSVNAFDRVIKVDADNGSEDIIKELDLNNMNIYEAIQKTVDKFVDKEYISNNSGLTISVSNRDEGKTSQLVKKMHEKIMINTIDNTKIQMVKVEALLN